MLTTACKTKLVLTTTSLALSLSDWRPPVLFSRSRDFSLPFIKACFPMPPLNVLRTATTSSRSRDPQALLSHFSKSASKSTLLWVMWDMRWTCNREQLVFGNSWALMLVTTQMGTLDKCGHTLQWLCQSHHPCWPSWICTYMAQT